MKVENTVKIRKVLSNGDIITMGNKLIPMEIIEKIENNTAILRKVWGGEK